MDDYYEDRDCWRCFGKGWILSCIDDICHGLGYCFHGDGYRDCPECKNEWDTNDVPIEVEIDFGEIQRRRRGE
jgi:hypothetical protein